MSNRFQVSAPALLLAATVAALGACGGNAKTTEPPSSASSSQSANSGISGEELLEKATSLSGSMITLQRCSLLTTPGSDGTLACRVLDKAGKDISDSNGLPVDIFIKQADLSPEAKAVVGGCSGLCAVQISGRLDRATDGTGYLSMTGVSLKAVS